MLKPEQCTIISVLSRMWAQQNSATRRLHEFLFMKRALDLVEAYKDRRLKVERIFIGGGGSDRSLCQEMAYMAWTIPVGDR